VRIWPHRTQGEGHFAARLRKAPSGTRSPAHPIPDVPPLDQDHLRVYQRFFESTLNPTAQTDQILPGNQGLKRFGNRLYWIPKEMPALTGLDVRHWGWWLGTFQSGKFMPSPALAAGLLPEDAQKVLEFALDDPQLLLYRRGSPLPTSKLGNPAAGWNLVCCTGHPLGWGLVHQQRMKSYFPGWLRYT
jgi:NOL1/NOP2/fmu family ribosome biogenesis protein